jgi:hypothetical protein
MPTYRNVSNNRFNLVNSEMDGAHVIVKDDVVTLTHEQAACLKPHIGVSLIQVADALVVPPEGPVKSATPDAPPTNPATPSSKAHVTR